MEEGNCIGVEKTTIATNIECLKHCDYCREEDEMDQLEDVIKPK